MLFPILIALVLAKIRKYELKPLLKAYTLYPFALLTLLLIFFQTSVFFHNYTWIKYASYIKTVYLLSLVVPFLAYKLFKPGIVGAALIFLGTFLNKLVIRQNGGKMPVYATLSKVTGYFNEGLLSTDPLHCAGTPGTKLSFLSDYIDIGYSILSIGDVLIHAFVFIILFYTIKELNLKKKSGSVSV
jgi:hypothetical protein